MSEIKVLKGKTREGKWFDIEDKDFENQEFIKVEIVEIMTKEEFNKHFGN